MVKARVTFPHFYPEGSLGHNDVTAREGHYIEANNKYELEKKFCDMVLKEKKSIDVQDWPSGKNLTRISPVVM